MLFDTVAIWGMGLLGGSLGMALRERRLARRVIGAGRHAERLEEARRLGACDEATCDLAEAFGQADLAVLCTPVKLLADSLPRLAPLFKDGAIVTDVGSTKCRIVEAGEAAMPAGRRFVGSHPMSGGETGGVANARASLFEGNSCFVTPTSRTDSEAAEAMRALWTAVGSRVIVMPPERHDALAATISHVPHLASAALALLGLSVGGTADDVASVAGNGFWDTTRLAKGDVTMWREICEENRVAISERLDQLLATLAEARALVAEGGDIGAWLERAREARRALEAARKRL